MGLSVPFLFKSRGSKMRIWKYSLIITDAQSICLPQKAIILSVQMQDNDLNMWVLHDREYADDLRHFAIYGTGHNTPGNPGSYIATVQDRGLVWHVFEVFK